MEYVEWVEAVLHTAAAAVSRDHDMRLGGVAIGEIAQALELGIDPMGPDFHDSAQRMAIIHAGEDLRDLGLGDVARDYRRITLTDEGRQWSTASLRATWPSLLEQARIDEERRQFLRAAAARSEVRSDRFATTQNVAVTEVFADLGWPWHRGRAVALLKSLGEGIPYLRVLPTHDHVRVTYLGVVVGTQEQQTRDQQLLAELIDDWETSTVDFKRELALDPQRARLEFAHDVLTLANVQGRQRRALVIGFDPNSREPVKSADPTITQDTLENIVNAYTTGRPPELRWRNVPWRSIVAGLLEILRDPTAVPYRTGGALREKYGDAVLIRRGTHSALADERELADLEDEAKRAREPRAAGE
ncbi:MAG: hypothetical protein M3P18_07980 [Actinomycetota bacterium]|nr:hypothetical protein [Actinomycetota bacterium]